MPQMQLASKTLEYDKLRESLTAKIGALERELPLNMLIAEYKSRLLIGAEFSPANCACGKSP